MATFKEGDEVKATTTGVIGTVLEVDGDTAYIMGRNGVEMEYCVRFLEPYVSPDERAEQLRVNQVSANVKRETDAAAITVALGVDIMAVGEAYFDTTMSVLQTILAQPSDGWDALTSEQKINYISVFFGLKPDMFFESYNNGAIDRLVKHINDIIAVAATNGGDILAAKTMVMMDFMMDRVEKELESTTYLWGGDAEK